jgi:hypothetical protein
VDEFEQIEAPKDDEDTMKLIRQKTRKRSRKLPDLDEDGASDEDEEGQIVESRAPDGKDRWNSSKKEREKHQEQEKSSLAEEVGEQPEGDGTNVHVHVHVSQLRIVLGTQENKDHDNQKKEDIKLHETDRFIFEMRELSMLT